MKPIASICLAISIALIAAPAAMARTRPHYGGVLRIETRAMAPDSPQLQALVAEPLAELDDQGRVRPLLADQWESQNGDRRWVFTVHPQIAMHDGTPLTGTVIADSINAAHTVVPWRSLRGTATAVIVESDAPLPNLPALLASQDFAIARHSPEGLLIGTGPYKVASSSAANATLEANDGYWRGRAYIDRVESYGARPIRTQWLDLGVNRADVVEVPGEFLRRAEQDHLRTAAFTPGELVLIVVAPAVREPKLRHALSLAIDRTSLSGVVFQKQGEPTATLLPNSMTGYGVLFGSAADLAAARDLRSQLKQVPPMTISYDSGDPTLQLAAERIALNAHDAGISLQAVPRSAITPAQLQLVRVALPSTDPGACLAGLSHALLGENAVPAANVEALYSQEREILEGYQLIPLLHLPSAVAVGERVRDLQLHWDSADLPNAWIEERR